MKRDMDLIREMLLLSEERGDGFNCVEVSIEDFASKPSEDSIMYHHELMEQDGLISESFTLGGLFIGNLTSAGHDFLDSVRDPEVWQRTKKAASEAGGWTAGLLGDLAKGFIKTKIQKHTGVEF